MIKDNEANIKAYEEEIRQLQIREKKLANNTRKKISRKLNAEIAVLTQRQKDLKTEG
ncbi:hypothetical protein 162310498 [Organic Lake phycodnavirus]|nr:hypothetical protein 162310498 [Organic Lake phycodnavirus]